MGVDLWDAGYNYGNFRYPGLAYMDPMWYFATWLSTGVGSFLMKLPGAGTMLAMNCYTAIFVSLLATAGFMFCTKILKLPKVVTTLAELAAISLCWIPTASLYNYLTYLLLTLGVYLLYTGLTVEKQGNLLMAGILLGGSVGVRFSNLVYAAFILTVWYMGILRKDSFVRIARLTAICLLGYIVGLALFLVPIWACYGLTAYGTAIARLFQMSKVATDYTPGSMITGILDAIRENSYWMKRIGLCLIGEIALCLPFRDKFVKPRKVLCIVPAAGLLVWLYKTGFLFPDFATYSPVYGPCVAVVATALLYSVYVLCNKQYNKEDKLLALTEILLLQLTSMGGNNAVFYCMNNMFLALPIFLYLLWKEWQKKSLVTFGGLVLGASLLLMLVVPAFPFGAGFAYEEAGGGRNLTAVVTEIPTLKGMKTGPDKAKKLEGLYKVIDEGRTEEEAWILYGQIPGLSYYYGLKPAITIWSDLDSYGTEIMKADLKTLEDKGNIKVLMTAKWYSYLQGNEESDVTWTPSMYEKALILKDFLGRNGYLPTYRDENYVILKKS